MGTDVEPIDSRKYTAEQIDHALLVIARMGGSAKRAGEQLDIPEDTLYHWKTRKYPRRYLDTANKHGHEIEDNIVQSSREIATRASAVVLKALDETEKQLDAGTLKEPARAAKDATVTLGVSVTKLLELTGRPTKVIEHRNADEILRRWEAAGLVNGTAEEIVDADENPALPPSLPAG